MGRLKVLNCYAGIGGNRKLWKNVDVVAIENNKEIATIYSEYYPKDKVIITDAHKYLLNHFQKFDFIWCSPPCPSHSSLRKTGIHKGQNKIIYPDMSLYQEIILLSNFFKGFWIIENVKPYYKPLINPTFELNRHYFWGNIKINTIGVPKKHIIENITSSSSVYGFNILNKKIKHRKDQILRNLVNPEIGKLILDGVFKMIKNKKGLFK